MFCVLTTEFHPSSLDMIGIRFYTKRFQTRRSLAVNYIQLGAILVYFEIFYLCSKVVRET